MSLGTTKLARLARYKALLPDGREREKETRETFFGWRGGVSLHVSVCTAHEERAIKSKLE
jgi:hypothetical protein